MSHRKQVKWYHLWQQETLLKIIQSLDGNKAHKYDGISIRMRKLSSPFIINALSTIFQNCLKSNIFPAGWKKEKYCAS